MLYYSVKNIKKYIKIEKTRQDRPWHLRPSCAPPANRPKSSVHPAGSQQNRLTDHKAGQPKLHPHGRAARPYAHPDQPKFFTHANATGTPPHRRQRHATPPLTASLTHPHGSNHEGSKGSRTGAGTQGQEKAPNQEQPQISTPAECTSRKIWPWRFLKAWIWIKKPTRERGRAGERTTNLTD